MHAEEPVRAVVRGKGVTETVVGPVHAGIIEPGRFTFASGGETVVQLDVQLGFSHRGVERFLIGKDALAAAAHVARICGGCSVAHSIAYAQALEESAGVTCEEPVRAARVVLGELERAYNHVFDIASMCGGAGYSAGRVAGLALKEKIMRIAAAATGSRLLFDAVIPGGIAPRALRDPFAVRDAVRALRPALERYVREIAEAISVQRRFEGSGRLSLQTAESFGVVGPALRASGGSADVRADRPYAAYARFGLMVARESEGDVAARFRVKSQEIRESLRLIEEAFGVLGERAPASPLPLRPGAGIVKSIVEGPRGAETLQVTIDEDAALRSFQLISASLRNWPGVAAAMEENIIPDFPLVNKSFNLCYACADR
jgi:Ni,Fe-hydrogenase III large subunit